MKRLRFALLALICASGFVGVGLVGFRVADRYLTSSEAARGCPQTGHHWYVTILNNRVVPQHTSVHRCDVLTITNDDDRDRLLAFGPHDHHISYDGVSERLIGTGHSVTITLVKTGTYPFHDHQDADHVHGDFTVR